MILDNNEGYDNRRIMLIQSGRVNKYAHIPLKSFKIIMGPCLNFLPYVTRQLPMGAGHCPWGVYTDWIVCNQKSGPLVHWRQQERWLRTDRITDHYYGQLGDYCKHCWCLWRISNGTNSPRLALLYHQNFEECKSKKFSGTSLCKSSKTIPYFSYVWMNCNIVVISITGYFCLWLYDIQVTKLALSVHLPVCSYGYKSNRKHPWFIYPY